LQSGQIFMAGRHNLINKLFCERGLYTVIVPAKHAIAAARSEDASTPEIRTPT
jgi:hypothetical protein